MGNLENINKPNFLEGYKTNEDTKVKVYIGNGICKVESLAYPDKVYEMPLTGKDPKGDFRYNLSRATHKSRMAKLIKQKSQEADTVLAKALFGYDHWEQYKYRKDNMLNTEFCKNYIQVITSMRNKKLPKEAKRKLFEKIGIEVVYDLSDSIELTKSEMKMLSKFAKNSEKYGATIIEPTKNKESNVEEKSKTKQAVKNIFNSLFGRKNNKEENKTEEPKRRYTGKKSSLKNVIENVESNKKKITRRLAIAGIAISSFITGIGIGAGSYSAIIQANQQKTEMSSNMKDNENEKISQNDHGEKKVNSGSIFKTQLIPDKVIQNDESKQDKKENKMSIFKNQLIIDKTTQNDDKNSILPKQDKKENVQDNKKGNIKDNKANKKEQNKDKKEPKKDIRESIKADSTYYYNMKEGKFSSDPDGTENKGKFSKKVKLAIEKFGVTTKEGEYTVVSDDRSLADIRKEYPNSKVACHMVDKKGEAYCWTTAKTVVGNTKQYKAINEKSQKNKDDDAR